MIGRNGERRSGISAQAARHDDDDDDECISERNGVSKFFLICSLLFFLIICISPIISFFVCFPLDSEGKQMISYLQDSSQYAGRSQQSCRLDDLDSFTDCQVLLSLLQTLKDVSNLPMSITIIFPSCCRDLFFFSGKIQVFIYFSLSFIFLLQSPGNAKYTKNPFIYLSLFFFFFN